MIPFMKRTYLAIGATLIIGAVSAAAGTGSYRDAVLADTPIVYYEFDETSGTTALNAATTGAIYHGTFNTDGGPVTVNQASFAKGGTCYEFGGGFVSAASALTDSLDEWTVEAWVNYDSAKASASNFLSNDQGGWNDDVLFGIGAEAGSMGVPAGSVGAIQQGSPGTTRDFVGSPLDAGEWHHVVVTGSTTAGALTLYVDGVLAGADTSLVNGASFNGADGIGTANLTVGAARPNAADPGYRPYDGLLDELAIYDQVLDAEAIASHYAASGEEPSDPSDPPNLSDDSDSEFGLKVIEYAPGSDPARFSWPTHIAFGPDGEEIISDLKNDRFMVREGPGEAFQASPVVSVRGQHSVAYNPADGLYYADDTDNHRMIAFDLDAERTLFGNFPRPAQTKNIAGVALNRPHDVVIDHDTGWIYALNPNSGHVFRFTVIGENESVIVAPVGGYARALTWANGKLYVIGSARGRIVEVVDWENETFKIYDSFDPSGGSGSAGTWATTGLVLNDAEFFDGFWYATSYFSPAFGGGTDFDQNKFIRFKTLDDLVSGDWTDLGSLVPSGMTPYFLTVNGGNLYLAIFNHGSPGTGDAILRFSPSPGFSIISAEHDPIADTTTLTWDSEEGEVFDVHKSLDLDSWMAVEMQIPAAAATSQTTTAIVDHNASESGAFYRVARLAGEE